MPSPVDMAGSSQSSAGSGSERSSALLSQSPKPPDGTGAASTAKAAGGGGAAGNICRKSYADTQTLARPSFNSTAAEWNSARKRSVGAAAAGGTDSGGDEHAMSFHEGGGGDNDAAGGGGLGARRWLHRDTAKSYAHGTATAVAAGATAPEPENDAGPSSKKKARRPHPLAAKFEKRRLERESASPRDSNVDGLHDAEDDANSPDEEEEGSSRALDRDAPAKKFRESYETKHSSHEKNLGNVDAIVRNREEAPHLHSFVCVPPREEEEDDEESMALTVPPSQAAFWRAADDAAAKEDDEEEEEAEDSGDEVVDFGGGRGFGDGGDDDAWEEMRREPEEVMGAIGGLGAVDEEEEEGVGAAKPAAGEPAPGEEGSRGVREGMEDEAVAKQPANETAGEGANDGATGKSEGPAYEGEYRTDDQDESDDDESELPSPFHGKNAKPAAAGKPPLRPTHAGKKGRRGNALALALEEEYGGSKPTNAPNDNGNGNAAKPKKNILRGRGRGAVAQALAAPDDATVDMEANDDAGDEKKRGKRRRQRDPTARALAEFAETGTVDSYFDRDAARRKAVLSKRHSETGGRGFFYEEEDEEHDVEDEDYGRTSFHGDEDQEVVGTERQSEPLLGTEMQSEPLLGTEKQSSEPPNETEKQSEPLLGTEKQSSEPPNGTEKQSEPLLSSLGAEQSATSGSATNGGTATNETTALTADQMVLGLRDEFDRLNKVLACAICRGTLNNALLLPCGHQYCSDCHKTLHNPKPVADPENKKRTLSPPKVKHECPECRGHATRRSGVPAPQTDEITKAYKQIEREFGWAPRKYKAEGIVMTQIAPGEGGSFDDFDSEEEEDAMDTEENRTKREHDYQEHLQVSATNQGALRRKKEEAQRRQTMSRKEDAERQNEVRRLGLLELEQNAVVRADEEAVDSLLRAHRRVGGAKEMVAAHTAKFFAQESGRNGKSEEVDDSGTTALPDATAAAADVPGKSEAANKPDSDVSASVSPIPMGKTKANARVASSETANDKVPANIGKLQPPDESQEDQFCTAPDDSQSLDYSTAREGSQGTSSLLNTTAASHTVIHDGNTAKKADRPAESSRASLGSIRGSNVLEWERSPEALRVAQRESMAAAGSAAEAAAQPARESVATAAGGNSPLVLHDGNTVRKERGPRTSNAEMEFNLDGDPTPRRSGRMSPLPAATLPLESAMEVDEPADRKSDEGPMPAPRVAAAAAMAPAVAPIVKGTIVVVQARTWPGINKPGGVARVTKVHPASAEGGQSTKYDVKYILGGNEKKVDESFVSINEPDPLPTIEESTRGSMSPEKKSRSVRPRKAAVKAEPRATAESSVPIYNDEDLEQIPDSVLKWAGIKPKGKKGKAKAHGGKKEAPRSKKRVLAETNANAKSAQGKKRKTSAKKNVQAMDEDEASEQGRSPAVETLDEIIGELSNEEMVSLADARYSSLLSLDEKPSKADPLTLHAVTSSLSDKDSKALDALCKMLKGQNIVLKITKDFNPSKTQLCITAPAASPKSASEPIDVVSQSRTLKVMRSALAGIPILTPQWVESCLTGGGLVAPSGAMCIRTLPRKQASAGAHGDDEPTERFGVAKYAAAYQKESLSSSNLLSGVAVMLCGSSAGSGMAKDLKVLLQQSGASIISSASMASRHLKDMSKGEAGPLVFLCDDSLTDKDCGISDALFKQAKKLVSEGTQCKEDLLCVHRNWLFDSISCATAMKAGVYEPLAPRAKALWDLTTEEKPAATRSKYESQVY